MTPALPFLLGLLALQGPALELPEDGLLLVDDPIDVGPGVKVGSGQVDEALLLRGLQQERLSGGTIIGGYGQFNATFVSVGPDAPFQGTATVRRLVLFVGHTFTNTVRTYLELEWENAIACPTCAGSVEIEQGFIEWDLLGAALSFRGGLVLVPLGIINQWHEPPIFHGVERPATDRLVIPSTWRELGFGFAGELHEGLRYEAYLTTAPDPLELGPVGLIAARTNGSLVPAERWQLSGRVELEPLLGMVIGLSGVAGDLRGATALFDERGQPKDARLPLAMGAFDARIRRYGLEARALLVGSWFPNAGALLDAYRADGSPHFPNVDVTGAVAEVMAGGYFEVGYDLLYAAHLLADLDTEQQLVVFARLEKYNTQAKMAEGHKADPARNVREQTVGISYRPIQQVVLKADGQLRNRQLGYDELQLNLGLGFMF